MVVLLNPAFEATRYTPMHRIATRREIEEITLKINEFDGKGARFLAHCLRFVGTQHGDHVTNAPPGYSWHQWGEALDCF